MRKNAKKCKLHFFPFSVWGQMIAVLCSRQETLRDSPFLPPRAQAGDEDVEAALTARHAERPEVARQRVVRGGGPVADRDEDDVPLVP